MNFLQKLFKKPITPIIESIEKSKNLNDIKQFDDIWVKFQDKICEGWVTNRDGSTVSIVYSSPEGRLLETNFTIERPLNREIIEQNNKTFYLTKKAAGL